MEYREVNGSRECLVTEYLERGLYKPCHEKPLTQSFIGPGVGLMVLLIGFIAVIGPQIDYRKTRVDNTLNRAKRSLG